MKHLFLFCLLLSASAATGQSYWEELKAPDGGAPTKITQTANGWVYAEFYDNAVFCSQDSGLHWEQIFWPSGDPDTGFVKITVGRAGTLFAVRQVTQLFPYLFDTYISVDNGTTWQKALDSSPISNVCQTSSGLWFGISTSNPPLPGWVKVVRSADQGITWDEIYQATQPFSIAQLQTDDYDRLVLTGSSTYFVVFSPDEGQTWKQFNGVGTTDEYIITFENNVLSRHLTGSKITRQYTGGFEEVNVDSTLTGTIIFVEGLYLSPESSEIYAQVRNQSDEFNVVYYYQSSDDGHSWTKLPDIASIYQLPVFMRLGDSSLIANRQKAIFRSTDNGQNWFISSNGINRNEPGKFEACNDAVWLAMTYSGFWKTSDAGENWQLKKPVSKYFNYQYKVQSFVVDTLGRLLVCADDSLFLSYDLGEHFINITPPAYDSVLQKSVGSNSATGSMFLRNAQGTSRSTDNGNSWSTVSDNLRLVKMILHPSGTLYASMDSLVPSMAGGQPIVVTQTFLYKSVDDGITWHHVLDSPIEDFTINTLGDVFAMSYYDLFRSVDNGNSWMKKLGAGSNIHNITSNLGNQLFWYGFSNELKMSFDFGNTWQDLPKIQKALDADTYYSYNCNFSFDPSGRMYAPVSLYSGYGFLFRTTNSTLSGAYLTGTVFKDADADCSTNDPESPLANWIVRADGNDTWYVNTDSAGRYTMFLDTGAYFLTVKPTLNLLWESCADSLPVQLPDLSDTTTQDVPMLAIAACPYMTVEVAVPWFERCFESHVYVQYCNLGTETADSAWVDIMLDPYLIFTDTLLSYAALGNNTFRFQLGTVGQGQCGNLYLSVYVDCDSTILGQTLCVSAHVYPDSLCITPPGWSGAAIQVTARCEQDTALRFEVKNTGTATSQELHYFVIEDDVVLMQGDESYDADETQSFTLPANGHFRRFESEQEPGHPFSMQVAAWAEGCGGFDMFGFPNWYFLNNGIPSQDVFCGEIVGAYDPNDKQGFPLGYGTEHLVAPNTDIEYLVRFQNTGTAAAHNVIIRDTLSPFLDPGSLRMGTASHPYTWALSGQGFLTVTFSDINLPDSNANEAASHGFFSFTIAQNQDLPDGTDIRNTASIYFDFNGAIRTNETLHRIGKDFIELVATDEPGIPALQISVFPNPVSESAVLTFDGLPEGEYRFLLTDVSGRVVRETAFRHNALTLQRGGLAGGVYFFRIIDSAGKKAGSGKLLLR